jgi:hypothetical protein
MIGGSDLGPTNPIHVVSDLATNTWRGCAPVTADRPGCGLILLVSVSAALDADVERLSAFFEVSRPPGRAVLVFVGPADAFP